MRTRTCLLVIVVCGLLIQACTLPTPGPGATATLPALAPTTLDVPPTALPTTPAAAAPRRSTADILAALNAAPCPDSDFSCVHLAVPLDHTNPANGQTIDIVFGVLPAGGERKGMFVTVVGGPGGSGLDVADAYTSAFDPALTEHFDLVFFDQRGVASSGGLQCVRAAAAFYQATPAGKAELTGTAQTFARHCVDEMGSAGLLPYLGTDQAIHDLEALRQAIGDETFWLYGESYGTQFAQAYAAAYPQHLAGLILDGPVDLTLTGTAYLQEQAQAFNDVLVMTLDACTADELCAADMGGDALAAYDELAARLAAGPLPFDFPLPSGGLARRTLTLTDLEAGASAYMYSEGARMLFLRALAAAAARDDRVPLARVLYDSLYLSPETLEPIPDPSYSDAVYYAVECDDYDYGPAVEYLRASDLVDRSVPRLASIFYGDLPCAFWPDDGVDAGRPAPLTAAGIPTLVMVGTADPATPPANARRLVSHLADGYLVVEQGGPHILFGWGNACVDDLVTAFLVDDTLPPQRETTCEGVVVDEYVPLAPADAADLADPLEAMVSLHTEILYLPEYYYWDGETPTAVGCPFGGRLTFEPSDEGELFTLEGCAFSQGFVATGQGTYVYNDDEDLFSLQVSVTGLQAGELTYTSQGDGSLHVSGTYGGESVDLSE